MQFFSTFDTFLQLDLFGNTISIKWYAILILFAAYLAYFISVHNAKKLGYDKNVLEDYFVVMLPLAIIGARLYYCIFEWEHYISDPISVLYIWNGGLAIHGGIIAGIGYAFYFFRKKGYNVLRLGDCILPNLMLSQVIGRIGNFLNHEAYGSIVDESFYTYFPNFIKENMFINGFYRLPTFLFEGVGNLIGFILITTVFKKYGWRKRGDMCYAYITWYGIVRFFVEGLRSDSLMFLGFRIAQIVSLLFVLIGVLGYLGVYDRVFKNFYPFKKEKPTILFDFDGTLADTFPLIYQSFKHTFETHPLPYEVSDEKIQSYFGPPLKESFAEHYPKDMIEEVVNTYRVHNHAFHDTYVKPLPHAMVLLTYLKNEGYDIGVVTSKLRESAQYGLKVCKMESFFDLVVCGDDVTHHKPHPEPLLKACKLMEVPHDNLIYVGDTPGDMMSAKNMGAFSIAYVSSSFNEEQIKAVNPCRIIYDLNDIKEILKEDVEWSEFLI